MAYLISPNNLPTDNAIAIYLFKEHLKSAGWVVKSSGDATTYFPTSDGITSGATGAGGFGNTNAWFRIQSPSGAGSREFLFQKNSGTTSFRWDYSASAGFTGGSPSATVLPTATDGRTVRNTTIYNNTGSSYFDFIADNLAPYNFACVQRTSGTGNCNGIIALDVLADADPLDQDSAILLNSAQAADLFGAYTGGLFSVASNNCSGFWRKGLVNEAFVTYPMQVPFLPGTGVLPSGLGVNPHSSKIDSFDIFYARVGGAATPGYKGRSTLMRANSSIVAKGDTNSDKTRVYYGAVSMPWDGVTVVRL